MRYTGRALLSGKKRGERGKQLRQFRHHQTLTLTHQQFHIKLHVLAIINIIISDYDPKTLCQISTMGCNSQATTRTACAKRNQGISSLRQGSMQVSPLIFQQSRSRK